MPTLRVVLDTNVLVSGLAYPGQAPWLIVGVWRRGGLHLVLSRYILDELAHVLPRLNRRLNWQNGDFANFIDTLAITIELVEPQPVASGTLRDHADLAILGTLLAAKADYLITGDRHLLELSPQYPIITPNAFWQRHGA